MRLKIVDDWDARRTSHSALTFKRRASGGAGSSYLGELVTPSTASARLVEDVEIHARQVCEDRRRPNST